MLPSQRQNNRKGWSASDVASVSTDTSKIPTAVDGGGAGPKISTSPSMSRADDENGGKGTADGYVGTADHNDTGIYIYKYVRMR